MPASHGDQDLDGNDDVAVDDTDLAHALRSQGEERGSSVSTQKVNRRSFLACNDYNDNVVCFQ